MANVILKDTIQLSHDQELSALLIEGGKTLSAKQVAIILGEVLEKEEDTGYFLKGFENHNLFFVRK